MVCKSWNFMAPSYCRENRILLSEYQVPPCSMISNGSCTILPRMNLITFDYVSNLIKAWFAMRRSSHGWLFFFFYTKPRINGIKPHSLAQFFIFQNSTVIHFISEAAFSSVTFSKNPLLSSCYDAIAYLKLDNEFWTNSERKCIFYFSKLRIL